jgi:cytochrome c553
MRLQILRTTAVLIAALVIHGCAPAEAPAPAPPAHNAMAIVTRCAACHGPAGISQNPIWPSLAGLDAPYLERQLDAFANGATGVRRSPHASQMYAISASLDKDQRRALAEYYAALREPEWRPRPDVGEAHNIFMEGAGAIQACASCHGVNGAGDANLNAPRISGQQARYVAEQLRAYASGARGDADSGMEMVAQAMTDAQIEAIAAYLAPSRKEIQ